MASTKEEMEAHFEHIAQTYEETFPIMPEYAREALDSMPPITSDSVIHDNACGPGIVTQAILERGGSAAKLHATDLSPAMVRVLKTRPWADKVEAEVMDATKLTFPDATFTHSLTNFAVMLMSAEAAAKVASHIHRTLKPGGTAEVATWAHLGYMDFYGGIAKQIKPDSTIPPGGLLPEHWLTKETLVKMLVDGGFDSSKIEVKQFSRTTPGDVWSRPGMTAMKSMLAKKLTEGWDESQRAAFEKALDDGLAEERESPKDYTMVAWIAVARK